MQRYNKNLGAIGESLAIKFLKKKGFNVVEKNYSCKWGEIDIIAEKEKRLHFVEVKTRTNLHYGRPEEAVTRNKYLKAKRAVLTYLRSNKLEIPCQIDVIAILYDSIKNTAHIRYFPNFYR